MTAKYSSIITELSIPQDSFWESIRILLEKPHVVNKRLWGCKVIFRCECRTILSNWNSATIHCDQLKNLNNVEKYKEYIVQRLLTEDPKSNSTELVLVELLPKIYSDNHAFQLVVLQEENELVTFYDVTPSNVGQMLCPDYPFALQWSPEEVVLKAECDETSKSYQWLKTTVLPQFLKWTQECPNKVETQICNQSLSLVPNNKYYTKYNELKLKHGKEMVKIWPECTDPSKFVYEDIAIAAYLLLLWEDENTDLNLRHKQSFVDLGCGNGLLVYILTKEGHQGVGIDVRKRQIWDMYSNDVKLEETTITPSDIHLFPETDWVIGNHSDELTPWIPVIAARSSYKCNFFLLPCCAFNFDGSKYQRQNSSKSQYSEYLQHIKQLCEDCGFKTDVDRLKIPSTKRICLIGRSRTYPEEEHDKYCNGIQGIINSKTTCMNKDNDNHSFWTSNFKAREPVERVKNCTQIDKNLIESMVQSICTHLLEGCNLNSTWCEGKRVEINDIVQLIDKHKLKSLKSECGGLQTLLKNNHHIFKVQSGKVQLRYPRTVEEVTSNFKSGNNKTDPLKLQQKPCWFYNYHPQGCPLTYSNCSFLHDQSVNNKT